MNTRCINIDWLEVYVLESKALSPCDANFFRARGFVVHERDYGTRVYREAFSLDDDHGRPWLEFRRNPYSVEGKNGGFFSPLSCHVRLSNFACYQDNAIGRLRDFLASFDYSFQKIFRIDICNDFVHFDKGDDPNRFLQRFIAGRYSKVNQTNISAHGVDQWNGRFWNSVSWGKPSSMVSTKLYCKTLELRQVHDKPYIKWAWFHAGLVDDPISCSKKSESGDLEPVDVWRVEFSLRSSASRWFRLDGLGKKTDEFLPNSLAMFDTPEKLLFVFASLCRPYFSFKVFEDGKRKDRCQDKVLFSFSPRDVLFKLDRNASHSASVKPEESLIRKLQLLRLIYPSSEVVSSIDFLIKFLRDLMFEKYTDPDADAREIQVLRQLLADRMRGVRDVSIFRQFEDLSSRISDYGELF